MKEHPKYFKEILEYEEGKKEGKKFKLRNKSVISFSRVLDIIGIRDSAKKHLIKAVKNLNEEATKEKTPDKVKIKKEPKQTSGDAL